MEKIGYIFKIENGFLLTMTENNKSYYVQTLDIDALVCADGTALHEAKLAKIVNSHNQNEKISAIKAVRNYCADNKFDKYYGLKDAKDYVESFERFKPAYNF